jgi:hypothetical protein
MSPWKARAAAGVYPLAEVVLEKHRVWCEGFWAEIGERPCASIYRRCPDFLRRSSEIGWSSHLGASKLL